MIPIAGKPKYTPSDETLREPLTEYERLTQLALRGRYNVLLRELLESGRFDSDRLEVLENTYRALSNYYAKGLEDPDRERFLRDIGKELLAMIRKDEEARTILRDPHHIRTDTLRTLQTRGIISMSYAELTKDLHLRMETKGVFYGLLEDVFNRIWTEREMPAESIKPLSDLLLDKREPQAGRAIVSALFVGAMEFFDPVKVELLFDAIDWGTHPAVRGAALPALLFIGRRYQEELLRFYPDLVKRGQQLISGDLRLNEIVMDCVIDAHISYNTEEEHRIFLEEILPTIKNVKNILDSLPGKDIAERMRYLNEKREENDEQLSEMRRLMEEAGATFDPDLRKGQDLEYHHMTQMKGFPFFQKAVNWFILYDPYSPMVDQGNANSMELLSELVFRDRQIVSSDLYSYAFAVAWEPLKLQLEQLGQEIPSLPMLTYNIKDLKEAQRDFILCAYRFYHLFTSKDRFHNPFTAKPYLLDGAFTQIPRLLDELELIFLADTLGAQGHYISAGYTYAHVISDWANESADAWRGLTVANRRLGQLRDALISLDKAIAEERLTGITATSRADLLWELGRRNEAVTFLEKAEDELQGQNVYLLTLRRARMLRELGRNEEALSVIYKAEYFEEELTGKKSARKLLIRLLLEAGRKEEALKKVEGGGEGLELHLGIALIANGMREEGMKVLIENFDGKKKNEEFRELLSLLEQYGIDEWERDLIYDTAAAPR